MFKKTALISAALVFAFGILTVSVLKTSAQTPLPEGQVEDSQVLAATKEKVEYYLPYPGILPDHFLYPVKMIRDKILLFLTTEPLKRAERLLHYADKRIEAARILVEGGKQELGVTTATKAEKYLEQAINQERIANEKGKDTNTFLERLSKATLKHEEILLEIGEKISGSEKQIIQELLEK